MFFIGTPTFLFLVQNLQNTAHEFDTKNNTLSGYLWVKPGIGLSLSSHKGSSHIILLFFSSFLLGIHCFQIGSSFITFLTSFRFNLNLFFKPSEEVILFDNKFSQLLFDKFITHFLVY